MTVIRKTSDYRVFRILAGLLGIFFIYVTVNGVVSSVSVLTKGEYPEVALIYAAETAESAVLSVICLLFMRKGDLSSGRRQAEYGCLFALGANFCFMFIAVFLIAILKLEGLPGDVTRLALVSSGGALGGILGLYLARPSSTIFRTRLEDKKEFVGSTDSAEKPVKPKPQWMSSVLIAVVTALGTSFIGWLLTYISPMLSPCIPSEAATDSGAVIGFGIISSMIWIVAGPLAMLFGGLLAYLTFRWFKLSERRSHTKSAALVSGGFPGLVFIIIIIVLYQKMLCA